MGGCPVCLAFGHPGYRYDAGDVPNSNTGYICAAAPCCLFSEASGHRPISTGKERDLESGMDYFGARYYAATVGRFMSADWSAQVEPVPYAKLEEPQSLNLYAYVRNNPISLVDPDGHVPNDGYVL